jgi:membrane protein implicated in regulation of membrane protease activity
VEPALWIALAVALAIVEIFTLTFVLLMLAGGAVAAALAAALGASVPVQATVFVAVSAGSLLAVRPIIQRHRRSAIETGETPFGVEAITGSTGLVLEQVDLGHGMIKIDGELWTARPYDATQVIAAGERVRVIEVKGATALVWRDE